MTEPDIRIDPDIFAALRPRLFAIAYRILGTRADAEDVVQDAWLRWYGAEMSELQSGQAWLVTVTTRRAIDRLRTRKTKRDAYSAGGCRDHWWSLTNVRRNPLLNWRVTFRWLFSGCWNGWRPMSVPPFCCGKCSITITPT